MPAGEWQQKLERGKKKSREDYLKKESHLSAVTMFILLHSLVGFPLMSWAIPGTPASMHLGSKLSLQIKAKGKESKRIQKPCKIANQKAIPFTMPQRSNQLGRQESPQKDLPRAPPAQTLAEARQGIPLLPSHSVTPLPMARSISRNACVDVPQVSWKDKLFWDC